MRVPVAGDAAQDAGHRILADPAGGQKAGAGIRAHVEPALRKSGAGQVAARRAHEVRGGDEESARRLPC